MRTPAPRRAGVVSAITMAMTVVLFGAFAAPASAHTRLISSTPGRDDTVAPVDEVTLVFSDVLSYAKVVVTGRDGKEFQSGAAERKGKTVKQKLTGELPGGSYTVAWAVVGEDGHRITDDDLKFVIDETSAASPAPPPPSAPASEVTSGVTQAANNEPAEKESGSGGGARWLMVGAGLLLGFGIGGSFMLTRRRPGGPGTASGD